MTSVTIPNSVTTIGKSAFYNCYRLTSISISNSVTTIGNLAFAYCGMTSITIPNSVSTIGDRTFEGCHGLTSITIPNSVTTIGSGAFFYCSGLTMINVGAANTHYCSIDGVLFNYAKDTLVECPMGNTRTQYTIPNSVTTIGDWAFSSCYDLTSITLPNSVTTIGNLAFDGCWRLASITIPNSVTSIGYNAFYGCLGLTSVTIPNSVTTIGNNAFHSCSGLTSVTIGNSVTTIGEWAFDGCTSLISITCYAENPPICESNCFYNVPKDIPLYIPYTSLSAYQSAEEWKNFTNINPMYFGACGEDLRWKYKNGTLSISGTGDMYDFTQTVSPWLDLKDSVTNIVFPSNITSIGKDAFYGFSKLTAINIPNSVTTIGDSAFADCTYLSDVVLGANVTDIGCFAFAGDFRLENITCYALLTPNVCSTTFSGINKYAVYLYVPESAQRKYQVDPNWSGFSLHLISAEKKPIDGENPVVTPTDQDVTITWPITEGTDTYTLTITKNGEVVCVLTFNAQGQLINIAFAAPGRDGAYQSPAATLTAQGYQFTVTGLTPGTAYDYSVTVTDAGGKTIAEHKGNFSTTGGESDLKSVHGSQCTMHKVFHNGQILLERNSATYTLMGQKLK